MATKTMNQRLRDTALDDQAALDLSVAAREAWAKEVDARRIRLASLLKRVLHREPDGFPAPLKGRMVTAEVGGFIFGYIPPTTRESESLGLVIECPVCGEFPAYEVGSYSDIGRLLENADVDRRCTTCVRENRR